MSFPTVIFGNYEIGIGFTDGSSIPTGGLRVFVVPTMNLGPVPLDIGITYVDQFGNTKTTTVTTSIPAFATSGTHFQIVLNSGDVGIRDIIDITVLGGSIGDTFNLESWNEGLGRPAIPINKTTPIIEWIDSEPTKEITDFSRTFSSFSDFYDTTQTNIIMSGFPDSQLSLPPEIIEPDYVNNINDFGFMRDRTPVIKDSTNKILRIDLLPSTQYLFLDANEQSTRLKWYWDPITSQYIDVGFYKLTFDYDVQFNSTYFIFELLDNDGTVVWSRTSTGTGTNQTVLFKSLSWEFRLRCKANYTSPASTTDHAQVSNIIIEKYIELGIVESNYAVDMLNIFLHKRVDLNSSTPVGTRSLLQLAFSDNGSIWSNWIGPDGTSSTYFEGTGKAIPAPLPGSLTGFYYKWKLYLQTDGRDTPVLSDFTLYMSIRIIRLLIDLMKRLPYPILPANPQIRVPIIINNACPRFTFGYPNPLLQAPPCTGGDYLIETLSNRPEQILRSYDYTLACPRTTPGYPVVQCATPSTGDFSSEHLTGRQLDAKRFEVIRSWLESVVGQVLSGYVTNTQDSVIKDAISIMLISSGKAELNQIGNVNSTTGFYQIFAKNTIYDKRYLIIQVNIAKSVSLTGAGNPSVIDGTNKIPTPLNIQFACPAIDCDFNITRKV